MRDDPAEKSAKFDEDAAIAPDDEEAERLT